MNLFIRYYPFLLFVTAIFAVCPDTRLGGFVILPVNISQKSVLTCGCLSYDEYKFGNYQTTWWKNGKVIDRPIPENYRFSMNNLTINKIQRQDEGLFNCSVTNPVANKLIIDAKFLIEFPPQVWINNGEKEIAIIEEYTIDLQCNFVGLNRVINIQWRRDNYTMSMNRTKFMAANETENARLYIKISDMTDRGKYFCSVEDETGTLLETEVYLRVKGKYRAVWVFLGICCEVVILLSLINYINNRQDENEDHSRVEFTIHSLRSSSSLRTSRAEDEYIQSEVQEEYEDEGDLNPEDEDLVDDEGDVEELAAEDVELAAAEDVELAADEEEPASFAETTAANEESVWNDEDENQFEENKEKGSLQEKKVDGE